MGWIWGQRSIMTFIYKTLLNYLELFVDFLNTETQQIPFILGFYVNIGHKWKHILEAIKKYKSCAACSLKLCVLIKEHNDGKT